MVRIPFTYDIKHNGQPIADVEGFAEVEAISDGRDVDMTPVYTYRIADIRLYVIGTGDYPNKTVEATGALRDDIEHYLWIEHYAQGIFRAAADEAENK